MWDRNYYSNDAIVELYGEELDLVCALVEAHLNGTALRSTSSQRKTLKQFLNRADVYTARNIFEQTRREKCELRLKRVLKP